jgi:hypothetical protein
MHCYFIVQHIGSVIFRQESKLLAAQGSLHTRTQCPGSGKVSKTLTSIPVLESLSGVAAAGN